MLTRQLFSYEVRNVMTVKAMPITHREEVKALYPIHVRRKNEGVLVLLEWVSRDVSDRCCKCELRYDIVPIIGLCRS